jgi:hypothetical protein
MTTSHILSLPDLVWLQIFSYLSCEDVLYAFAELQISHLNNLLIESGAFRHICLLSVLPRHQYETLLHVWYPDFVRSLVLHEMLAELIYDSIIDRSTSARYVLSASNHDDIYFGTCSHSYSVNDNAKHSNFHKHFCSRSTGLNYLIRSVH